MKNSIEIIFTLSLFITILMGALSYLTFRRNQMKEIPHLLEFWGAMGVQVLAYYFFRATPQVAALAMLGWIWPLRSIGLIQEDITGIKSWSRWHYIALACGGLLSLMLASFGTGFLYFTMPFALSLGLVGLAITFTNLKPGSRAKNTPLQMSFFIFSGLYFVTCMAFPYWRLEETTFTFGLMAVLFVMLGFAGVGLSLVMEQSKKHSEEQMEAIFKARNAKVVGNSKYSELGMMAAGIAHEINNPLAVIQARITQLLRIYRDPGKQQELSDGLQQVLYTSERINRTIQGVREFVHDERRESNEIKLKDLIDDVLTFCGQRMKNHGINLRFYGLENLSVWGNKVQLEQILLNLLNNSFDAIEFLPDKWIELSAHQDDDRIQIFVKDSGNGIPAEVAAHIMEPFFSTKDVGKGTGLGLALARGIAEKHGGNLKYLDNVSHTTFMLELPKQPREDWGLPMIH